MALLICSKGKYTKVLSFEAKYNAEQYIRTLPIKSAFVSLGSFTSNFHAIPFFKPKKTADGTYVLSWAVRPQANWPLIDAEAKRTTVPADQIEQLRELSTSIMPEDLLRQLRPQEVRDLFA